MGIRAIEYRPWKGDRTDPNRRWLVVSNHMFQKNVRAKAVIVLLILGMMFAHAFPIIGAIMTPHEEITDEDMVGGGEEEPFKPNYEITEGDLEIVGNFLINGSFEINGTLVLNYQEISPEEENMTQEELNETFGSGSIKLNGTVYGLGTMGGFGRTSTTLGFFYVKLPHQMAVSGFLQMGDFSKIPFDMDDIPPGMGPGDGPGEGPEDDSKLLFDLLMMADLLTTISGNGNIIGNGTISGKGTIEGEIEDKEEEEIDFSGGQGYLASGIFIIFTMLLAAIICADVISSDLANSSFVLYFSRPVRAMDYLIGKFVGISMVMWLFCLVPPIAYVLVMIGTQTGDEFSGGVKILGKTVIAGLVTAVYFLPYGLMISSFTKSKAYAGIGIFMSFFVLLIISGIFSETSDKWTLISPVELLINFYRVLFNGTIPEGITSGQVGVSILAFTVIPMAIVILWIQRKGAGK